MLGKTERYCRVILAAYQEFGPGDTDELLSNLPLFDAMKDCIEEDSEAWREWKIDEKGKVEFE